MTKRKSKSTKSTVKAAAAKVGHEILHCPCCDHRRRPPLIVLGFDDQQKPRGARFVDARLDLVTKAADPMGFKVYEASSEDVAEAAKKLPLGRLYANGRGFVPNVRQDLYSDLVVALALEPEAALSRNGNGDKDGLPALVACPSPGTRSGLAIWSSPRNPSTTAGGRQSSSTGKATPSPCGTAITRTFPSSSGIAAALR